MNTVRTVEGREVSDQEGRLTELYEANALRSFRFAYMLTGDRVVAEDLLQEAFIRAFDRLDTLREQDAFPGYLRTTILNLARAHLRRQRIERLSLRRQALVASTQHDVLPDIDQRERLWQALHRLPYRQRAALVLRYYEDLSERDTARTLGTSVAGVKALVSRGTKALRGKLEP
ncbi:MAG: SigE family RNA polymerase sigma factor [Gaiellales bacterium]